jgi:hypothetical protein
MANGIHMLDFLTSPGAVIGVILGIGCAAFVHWAFPSLANATFLYVALIAIGFIAGLWLGDKAGTGE